jgi:hypothetical protein
MAKLMLVTTTFASELVKVLVNLLSCCVLKPVNNVVGSGLMIVSTGAMGLSSSPYIVRVRVMARVFSRANDLKDNSVFFIIMDSQKQLEYFLKLT